MTRRMGATMKTKSWFSMASKSDEVAEISIFDEIDPFWGIGPKQFKDELDKVRGAKSIKLLLNSPGGSVFDGMAVYNLLASVRDKLDVEVIGLAASIASIIAMAGKSLTVAEGAYLMIHDPFTLAVGGADDLRKTADLLDTMKGEFVAIYAKRSGLSDTEIADMMSEETWFTASEAVDKGFADGVEEYGEVAANASRFNLAKYGFGNTPSMLAESGEGKKITTPRELEGILRDAGFSKSEAVAIASRGLKALDRRDSEEGDQRESEVRAETSEQIKIRMNALLEEAGIPTA